MDINKLSDVYAVRLLTEADIHGIYALCRQNPLYYRHCPPFVTEEGIRQDMEALPPGKAPEDKFYIGWFDKDKLVAVMDLIRAYPDEKTWFIGFFMTDVSIQGKGVGSRIIEDLCKVLADDGAEHLRLCWVDGNPQAEHFWHKNAFMETGATSKTKEYTVIIAQRDLKADSEDRTGGQNHGV